MNATWALARIRMAEAAKAARAESDWTAAHSYAIRRDEAARDRARQDAIARMRDTYAEKWRAKQAAEAKAAARTATRGPGWRLLDHPKVSHEELDAFARRLWNLGFVALPWPAGWKVRWGRLRPSLLGAPVLGMTVRATRVIVIDERAHRSGRDLLETILHELTHVVHPEAGHGAAFAETLQRVLMFVTEEELGAAPTAARRHPEPPRGQRWGPAGFFVQPGLDVHMEYRG